MSTSPGLYGECGGGTELCALSNCCSVVNIFILNIRVGSESRGTSHSRSAELHDGAHAAARGISTSASNFVTARLRCLSSVASRSRTAMCVSDAHVVSTSKLIGKLCDLAVNLDVSEFESSGLPPSVCCCLSSVHCRSPDQRREWSSSFIVTILIIYGF